MTTLTELHLTKVALCAQGMNPDADILLYKSKDKVPSVDKPVAKTGDPIRPDFYAPQSQAVAKSAAPVDSLALRAEAWARAEAERVAKAESISTHAALRKLMADPITAQSFWLATSIAPRAEVAAISVAKLDDTPGDVRDFIAANFL